MSTPAAHREILGTPKTSDTRAFARLWAATFLCFSAFYGIAQPLAQILARAAFDPAAVGLVLGAFGAAALVARPLAGWLSDRLAPRWVLGGGALALAVGVGGLAWATTVETLVALRVLQGVGYAAFTTAGTAWAAGLGTDSRRAGRIARYGMAANLALSVIPAVIGMFQLAVSAQHVLSALGLIALAAGVCAQGSARAEAVPMPRLGGRREWVEVARRVGARPWWLALCVGLGFGAFLQYAPVLAGDGVSVLFTAYGVAILLVRALSGAWLDRTPLAYVARVSGLILILGMALLTVPGAPGWAGAAAIGAGGGVLHPAVLAAAVRGSPATPGQATGWTYVGFDLGLTLSGWALGPVLGLGGAPAVFAVTSGLMVIVAVLGVRSDD